MRSSNRRGLELAANTIVLLLVGITMLGLSIGLTYTIFCGAEEYAATVDGQTASRVEQLLAAGGRVQVADNTQVARQRGSIICGRDAYATASFALGIQNSRDAASEFNITVTRTDPDTSELAWTDQEVQVLTPVTARAGEVLTTRILIATPPSTHNQYTYTVTVEDITDLEDKKVYGIQRIYVQTE